MDLEVLQHQHRAWLRHNFPEQTAEDAFLGMVEEMGELAHAMLKRRQNIRDQHASPMFEDEAMRKFKADIADGVADWIIFADGFCYCMGIDLPAAVSETWKKVKQRDWVKYPETGLPPIQHLVDASPPVEGHRVVDS